MTMILFYIFSIIMTTLDWASGPVNELAEGFRAIEAQHAQYRDQLLVWVRNAALAHVNSIANSPNNYNSVFRNPDSITITIYFSLEDFFWFFNIVRWDNSARPPIVESSEITNIVGNAIQQKEYALQVLFEDSWPNDQWFHIILTKHLDNPTENPSN